LRREFEKQIEQGKQRELRKDGTRPCFLITQIAPSFFWFGKVYQQGHGIRRAAREQNEI
jgi:hypothetical protein